MRLKGTTAEVTRRRVEEAAVSVFARKGFAAAGVREIAEEAGLTSAALYHYMKRKEDLLIGIMRSSIEPLAAAAEAALLEYEDPATQLCVLVELHVWLHGMRPAATFVADTELRSLSEADREEMVALRDRYESLWRTVLHEGVVRETFEVPDEPLATNALLDLCNGVSQWYTSTGRLGLEDVCWMHSELALAMVRASRRRGAIRRDNLTLPHPGELLDLETDASPSSAER
jgi:AcrR family transcriptional regulator